MAVEIKHKAFKKMYSYCKQAKHGEIGGLILGKLEDTGDVTVKDVILLEQVRSQHDFEITDEAMMEFTKNADNKVLSSVIGWWHYHLAFGTFWSSDDSNTFTRLTQLSNFCLGLVGSIPLGSKPGEMDMRCRLDMYNREGQYVSVDGIEHNIEKKNEFFNFNFWGTKIENEVKGLVKEDERDWVSCPRCYGQGMVEAKHKRQGNNVQIQVPTKDLDIQYPTTYDDLSDEEVDKLDEMVGGQYTGS